MARTYVLTGDPAYKKYYQEILDIRDGRQARPEQYEDIYWDLVFPDQAPPRPALPPTQVSRVPERIATALFSGYRSAGKFVSPNRLPA